MALEKHFGDTRSAAQISVYLEWGMEVPKISCGTGGKQSVQSLIGSVSVLGSRPKINAVSDTPACRLVSTLRKSYLCGIKPCGSGGIDYITRIKSDKMGNMAVLRIAQIAIVFLFSELLYLSRKTDDNGIVFIDLLHYLFKYGQLLAVKNVTVGKVNAQLLCGKQSVIVVLISKGLSVGSAAGIVPNSVNVLLGRVAVGNKIISVLCKLYALYDITRGRNEKRENDLLKNGLIARVLIIFPEYLCHLYTDNIPRKAEL